MKAISLIFNEHEKLSIENPLLKQQIKSLEELNRLYVETDSIREIEMNVYQNKVNSDENKIQQLKTTQRRIIVFSSMGSIILFIIGLFL